MRNILTSQMIDLWYSFVLCGFGLYLLPPSILIWRFLSCICPTVVDCTWLLSCISPTAVNITCPCPPVYSRGPDNHCYHYNATRMNATDAQAYCASTVPGAYMVEINSGMENNHVQKMISKSDSECKRRAMYTGKSNNFILHTRHLYHNVFFSFVEYFPDLGQDEHRTHAGITRSFIIVYGALRLNPVYNVSFVNMYITLTGCTTNYYTV